MDIYSDAIRPLPAADRLKLVERIWDDLVTGDEPLPLPAWALEEAARRRNEMHADPKLGYTHDEVWKRIRDARNG